MTDQDPTGLPLFRRVGSVGTRYVGKMPTVTALVDPTCLGAATCTPTTTPAVAVHVLLGGSRIASVKPPALGTGTGAFDEVRYDRYPPYGQFDRAEG